MNIYIVRYTSKQGWLTVDMFYKIVYSIHRIYVCIHEIPKAIVKVNHFNQGKTSLLEA